MAVMSTLLLIVASGTALGAGLMAGVFFAFSVLVMRAFAVLPPRAGLVAMQSVNLSITPLFLFVLLGTAVASVALTAVALADLGAPSAGWVLAGSLSYLVGVMGLTVAYHVPRNNALAAVDPASDGAEAHWVAYRSGWTAWNHVRTVSALVSLTALVVALARS